MSFEDFRAGARSRLPKPLFEFIDGGAIDEVTLASNVRDLQAVTLRQRVLKDVSSIAVETEILGEAMSFPLILGPVGMTGMYWRRGEVAAGRAAKAASIPFCLSTHAICSVEEMKREGAPFWLQLYMFKDRAFMRNLLDRAAVSGCLTIVLTVDVALAGIRYRDLTSGLAPPKTFLDHLRRIGEGLRHPAWTWDVFLRGRPHDFGNISLGQDAVEQKVDIQEWSRLNWDPGLNWNDVEWLRANWNGAIILKGLLDPEDARQALLAGVDAIVVSNHGGRQLDGALSSVRALPAIVGAVNDELPVLVDSGIRSGFDIFKMLALGAKACLVGRHWAFALSARGEEGVHAAIATLRRELEVAMALTGCVDVHAIPSSALAAYSEVKSQFDQ